VKISTTSLVTVLILLMVVSLSWWTLSRSPARTETLTDLPWQIEQHDDGSTSVFGLHLGEAVFQDAAAKFGPPESIAVFATDAGPRSLEAYFGRVTLGRMDARVIVNLDADPALMEDLTRRAREREAQPSGATRLTLPAAIWDDLADRPVASITYLPEYGGLDEAFMRARFGEPASTANPDRGQVQLVYPDRGVRILVDEAGKEMFEYSPVR
jgi:hypothetical protein